jgi:rhamnosyltransferase
MLSQQLLILLGTYNGDRFLREQLESIQRQTVTDWTLLVRDDGSIDGTLEILERFSQSDRRIVSLHDRRGRLGAVGNYGELMRKALERQAGIVFFSDQDDIWSPTKVGEQIGRIKELEKAYGNETPILVHSDLEVVDATLHRIHRSFMHFQGLSHEVSGPLRVLLVQNFVTGCATAINRALLELAVPIPTTVVMHDWWLALCAAACGQMAFLSHPTVFYRQHGRNEIGAKSWWKLLNPFHTNLARRWEKGTGTFLQTLAQAGALHQRLLERYGLEARESAALAQQYAGCLELPPWTRLDMLRRTGIHRQGFLGQCLLCLRLVLMTAVKDKPYLRPV